MSEDFKAHKGAVPPQFPLNQKPPQGINAETQMTVQKLALAREIIAGSKFDLVSMSTMDCSKAVHAALEIAEIFDRSVRDQLNASRVKGVGV